MITHRIHAWAQTQPTRIAIIYNDTAVTYADWSTTIHAMRRFVATHGLPAGGTVGVLVENLFDAWSLVLAIRACGATTILLQSIDAIAALELRDLACIVVSQPEVKARGLDLAATPVPSITLSESAIRNAAQAVDASARSDDAARFGGHIVYTSGTTGSYKKLLLSPDNESKRNEVRGAFFGFRNDTCYHGNAHGLWTAMGSKNPPAVWHAGGCVVFDQRTDWPRHFFRHPITHAGLIPPMVKELLDCPERVGVPREGFKLSVAAGFLPLNVVDGVRDTLKISVSNVYGSTELNVPPLRSVSESIEDFYWLEPTPGRRIRIVDEHGRECDVGEEGELHMLLLDLDCSSYVDDPDATARIFRDGWFCPGDLAVRRDDGRIQIRGRATDVINVEGQKIAAAPIELAIQRELGVNEVCLFSGLASDGIEELVVAVESDRKLTSAELRDVAAQCARFPRVRFVILSEFPRTQTGTRKTLRMQLRKRVFELLEPGLAAGVVG